jgi:CheY-like chemotaxis protein
MNILVLEDNPAEQEEISALLSDDGVDIRYESSIPLAMNSLGIHHTDFALVDADCADRICKWYDLVDFLNKFKINYAVFSSNGKVGVINGQKIVHLRDIPDMLPLQHAV